MKAKLIIAGLVVAVASLAIAENAPEIIAKKIQTEVNGMKLSTRIIIAWRVLFAKL